MKKFLLILLVSVLFTSFCYAKNVKVKVESLNNVSIDSHTQNMRVRVIEETKIKDDITLQKDSVLDSRMIEIVPPKRAKRNGYVVVEPILYIYNGLVIPIQNEELRAKLTYYVKPNYKKAAIDTGIGIGASFVKGGKYIASFSEGVIIPKEGESRIKSGFENLYENSALSYAGKGKEVNIKRGDILVYKFFLEDTPKWQFWKR